MPANQNIQKDGSAKLIFLVVILAVIILSGIILFPLLTGVFPEWSWDEEGEIAPLEANENSEVVLLEGCDLAIKYADDLEVAYLPKDQDEPVEIGVRLAKGEDRLVINCLARLEDADFDQTIPYPPGVSERETVDAMATPLFTEASEPEIINVEKLFIEDLEVDLKTRWLVETVPDKLIYVDVYNNGARLYDDVELQFDYLAPTDPSVYLEEITEEAVETFEEGVDSVDPTTPPNP